MIYNKSYNEEEEEELKIVIILIILQCEHLIALRIAEKLNKIIQVKMKTTKIMEFWIKNACISN